MRSRWFSRRSVVCHVTLVVLLVAFAELFAWQVRRATSGNELSWVYVFEWPVFGVYAVYMWWKLVHEPDFGAPPASGDGGARRDPGPTTTARPPGPEDEDEDAELAAYNRYLAALHESGRPKRW